MVIGVRRSGKSTICHKVLLERGIRYGYVNLDDDRLADMLVKDLNTVLSCVYQLYGTDISYLVLDELATHLTGRYNEIHLYPFSFSEYCQYHRIDTQSITTKADADRKRAFMDYIHDGGFPEMQGLRNKKAYVQSLIEAILRKDIQKRFKIRNIEALRP